METVDVEGFADACVRHTPSQKEFYTDKISGTRARQSHTPLPCVVRCCIYHASSVLFLMSLSRQPSPLLKIMQAAVICCGRPACHRTLCCMPAQEPERAQRMNDALEGLVVLCLSAALWLVLRRRRSLRAAGQQPPAAAPSQAPAPQEQPQGSGSAAGNAAACGRSSAGDGTSGGVAAPAHRQPRPDAAAAAAEEGGFADRDGNAGGRGDRPRQDGGAAQAPFKRLVHHLSVELAQAAGTQPAASAGVRPGAVCADSSAARKALLCCCSAR